MAGDAYLSAEAKARVEIDRQLGACGWLIQNRKDMNLYAGQGVAVREFIMASGHGRVDYLLFVDGKAVGAIEAKPSGTPLAGVEPQSANNLGEGRKISQSDYIDAERCGAGPYFDVLVTDDAECRATCELLPWRPFEIEGFSELRARLGSTAR